MEVPKQEISVDTSQATKINNRAAEIFYDQLKSVSGNESISYLKDRGISGETAKFFQLGYLLLFFLLFCENVQNCMLL